MNSFSSERNPGVRLLDHMAILILVILRKLHAVPIMAALIYIAINSVLEFLFLYIYVVLFTFHLFLYLLRNVDFYVLSTLKLGYCLLLLSQRTANILSQ